MKELDSFLKVISEGLKTLSGGVAVLAEKVDEVSKNQAEQRKGAEAQTSAQKPATAKRSRAAKPAAKAKPRKKAPASAPTTGTAVYNAIKNSKRAVDAGEIKAKTGLSGRQVSNAVYKLKKAGKIKSPKRGTYVKA